MGDLTANFSRSEFRCPCGCDETPAINQAFADKLQLLRNKIGPIKIGRGCGYRCATYNAKIGGAEYSRHIDMDAADLHAKRVPHWVAVQAAMLVGFQGIGFGKSKLHVDEGDVRWWTYQSKREHVG